MKRGEKAFISDLKTNNNNNKTGKKKWKEIPQPEKGHVQKPYS